MKRHPTHVWRKVLGTQAKYCLHCQRAYNYFGPDGAHEPCPAQRPEWRTCPALH